MVLAAIQRSSPLYACVRRCGQTLHDAHDLTWEFFSRLLEKRWLDSANREKGKLPIFLIAALEHFMSHGWMKIHRLPPAKDKPPVSPLVPLKGEAVG